MLSMFSEEQVVPSIPTPELVRNNECENESETDQLRAVRKLPEVKDSTRMLDLFGETTEIFASRHEE